ncbi:uncharacterized protein LOC128718777 [Anopheles marshallii]|uniref:uncharacterized protein LOC128718777 n=1 Tax=Anopheles marshallii TaxID=1521116 RepID=UPI00237A129B|nr:uncharacterized protein LOC128718777 [Anopheles marshallii]
MNSIEQNLAGPSLEEPTKELLSSTQNPMSSSSTGFDHNTTLQLIACVQKRPKLWHRQFLRKRKLCCQHEWEDIQQKEFPSYTVDQLKARWKTMRDSFRREIRRTEFGKFSRRRWPLYENMLFLDGHFRLRKSLQHKEPSLFAKRKVASIRSEESVVVQAKKVAANDQSTTPITGITVADVKDAPVGISEVTYCNKFRSRINSKNPSPESTQEVRCTNEQEITDGQFLMSLVPFLRMLPLETNLEVRLKVLHLIANATRLVNVSQNK